MQCLLNLFEVAGKNETLAKQPDVTGSVGGAAADSDGNDGWHGWGGGFLWKVGIGLSFILPQLQTGQSLTTGNPITNPVTDVVLPIARGGSVNHYLDDGTTVPTPDDTSVGGINYFRAKGQG